MWFVFVKEKEGRKKEKAALAYVACVLNKTSSWISTGFEESDNLPKSLGKVSSLPSLRIMSMELRLTLRLRLAHQL